MPLQSTLRPSQERVAQLVNAYARHRPLVQRALTVSFIIYVISSTYRGLSARSTPSSSKRKGKGKDGEGSASKPKVAVRTYSFKLVVQHLDLVYAIQVDALFYQRLSRILRIVIPSLRSKEALLLCMHSSLLIFRTVISLYVAALDGK